jgi:hypothetical protein
MPAGFEPHMQKQVGSKPNCRGRRGLVLDFVDSDGVFVDHAVLVP